MKKIIFISFLCILACRISFAQPAWSRGIQVISFSHNDCMTRASGALTSEGYSIQYTGGDFIAGQKGIHTAIIACNATSDGRSYVNIFVASTTNDGNIPGAERVRLQARMDNTAVTRNVIQCDWNTQPNSISGRAIGNRYTIVIPPGGTASSRIWGSDVYTDDSSIGTCAVHAGLITFQSGGTVTIEIRPGQGSYESTTRNGITSRSYGGWGGSFVFVR